MIDISHRLVAAREKAGMTQQVAAAAIGICREHLAHMEAGRNANPQLSTLLAIARAYGRKVGWFIGEID